MGISLVIRTAVLLELISAQPDMAVWRVSLDGETAEAVAYLALVGELESGEQVLVNTTAVELELGTGGQHFIIAQLGMPPETAPLHREDGHILKLRYTPLQGRVLAA